MRSVIIHGPAGCGKSRVIDVYAQMQKMQGYNVTIKRVSSGLRSDILLYMQQRVKFGKTRNQKVRLESCWRCTDSSEIRSQRFVNCSSNTGNEKFAK